MKLSWMLIAMSGSEWKLEARSLFPRPRVLTFGPQHPVIRTKVPSLACLVKKEFRWRGTR